MKKIIRLTESELNNIVENAVKRIIKEDYYSMQKPYGTRRFGDYSSKESKALHDYDPNFAVRHEIGTDNYEAAPLRNAPYNEPEWPEDDQPYQYWDSLIDYENRMPLEPSEKDKKAQMERDWRDQDFKNDYGKYVGDDSEDEDYNFNVHPDSFEASGAKGRVGRLNAFDDSPKGTKAKKFNGTFRSLR